MNTDSPGVIWGPDMDNMQIYTDKRRRDKKHRVGRGPYMGVVLWTVPCNKSCESRNKELCIYS